MGMDPFVVFPTEWAAAGFEIHTTPPTLPFPSGTWGTQTGPFAACQTDFMRHE